MLALLNTHVAPRATTRTTAQQNVFKSHGIRPVPLVLSRNIAPRQVAVQGLFGLGVPELAVIAGVVALIYGPSKLPELGKGLGKTAKSFQTAAKEFEKELKEELKEDEESSKSTSGSSKDE